jgi:glycosyltransferase involved in cell wall biosynthesis
MARHNSRPLVSICIPCYNQRRFLPTLFGSLLGQTYDNLEIIFLDDDSRDDSWEVSQEYRPQLEAAFPRVHMEKNATNLGALKNLQKSFALVTGDFASYLEADDYYAASKVERNLEFLELNPSFGAVHSDFYALKEDLSVIASFNKSFFTGVTGPVPSGWIFDRLLQENVVCAPTLMVRREFFFRSFLFDLFYERDYGMGDYPALMLLSQMTKIGYIDEPLAFYRMLEVSMSHSPVPGEKLALKRRIARVKRDARLGRLSPAKPEAMSV